MAPVINFAFPMVKRFDAELDYSFEFFGMRLNSGHMEFTSANITLAGAFKFTATSKGHIYP